MRHLNALLISLQHIILLFIESAESFYDLVLAWIVNLLECFLHLCLQLDIFDINFLDSLVL
jgi:hypothetical protein